MRYMNVYKDYILPRVKWEIRSGVDSKMDSDIYLLVNKYIWDKVIEEIRERLLNVIESEVIDIVNEE